MPSKHPFLKKAALGLSFFGCSALLFVAFLPALLSTSKGKDLFLSVIGKKLPGSLKIEDLSLQWSGPQKITGIHYEAFDGQCMVSCPILTSSSSLLALAFSPHDVGLLSIEGAHIEIHPEKTSSTLISLPPIQSASLGTLSPLSSYLPSISLAFCGNISLQNTEIALFQKESTPIFFSIDQGQFAADQALTEISCFLKGSTRQSSGEGSISIAAKLEGGASFERSLSCETSLQHFPMDGMDQLLSMSSLLPQGTLTEIIGSSLDLDCKIFLGPQASSAFCRFSSPSLQGKIETSTEGDSLILSSPAAFKLALSSSGMQKLQQLLPSLKSLPFSAPFDLSLLLNALTIPRTDPGISFKKASFEGILKASAPLVDLGTIAADLSFSSSGLSSKVSCLLEASARKKDDVCRLTAQALCLDPLSASKSFTASAALEKTSSSFLETLFPASPISLSLLFGDSLEASFSCKGQSDKIVFSPILTSPLLQIEQGAFAWEQGELALTVPLHIRYLLQPHLIASFSPPEKKSLLLQAAEMMGTISRFKGSPKASWENLALSADITSPSIELSLPSQTKYPIENFNLHVETDTFKQISLSLKTDRSELFFEGGFDLKAYRLFWKKPLTIQYALNELDWLQFYPKSSPPFLLEKTDLSIQIEPSSFSLKPLSWSEVVMTAHIGAKDLLFHTSSGSQKIGLQNLQTTCKFLGAKDVASFSLLSDLLYPPYPAGKLSCQGTVKNWNAAFPNIQASFDLKTLPLEAVDQVLSPSFSLASLLGKTLDLKLDIASAPQATTFQINGKSSYLELSGDLSYSPEGIFLTNTQKPLKAAFLLTPQAYEHLNQKTHTPFILTKEALFMASASQARIPFLKPGSYIPDLSNMQIAAQVANAGVSFQHKGTTLPLVLENILLSIEKIDAQKPLSLLLDAKAGTGEQGSLHLEMAAYQILGPDGNFSFNHLDSSIAFSLDRFPSSVLDVLSPPKPGSPAPLSLLFGPSLDMKVNASFKNASGPLALELSSKNVDLSCLGELQQGVLKLKQDALARLFLTPESSKVLLQKANPLSLTSLSGPAPFSVQISARGFSFPLDSSALDQINIPNARIAPGKLFCQNEGNLNLMLGMLKSKQARQSKQLELWFAPLDLHVDRGIVNVERTEILIADTYDIAVWGRIDLPKDRVNMVLGLTASCLKEAFHIKELPKDYVLHIPLTGTLSHVELNKGAASSKILALTLWDNSNIAGPAGKGIGGALLGGIVNKVLTPPGNEGPTPPAKRPFPWE